MNLKVREKIRQVGAARYLAHPMSPVVSCFVDGWEHRDELVVNWIPENELPSDYPYDEMFPVSKPTRGSRFFPPIDAIEWIRLGKNSK